jgi:hypothetical protein
MTTIEFALDETTTSIEITPEDGDPNAVFRTAPDRIAAAATDHGYRFKDDGGITYQELTKAYRETPAPETIALGDLSGRLVPVDVTEEDPDPDGITLTLIGPAEERLERTFGRQQNLGAVAAAVTEAYDLGMTDQVVLAPTAARDESLTSATGVDELADPTV